MKNASSAPRLNAEGSFGHDRSTSEVAGVAPWGSPTSFSNVEDCFENLDNWLVQNAGLQVRGFSNDTTFEGQVGVVQSCHGNIVELLLGQQLGSRRLKLARRQLAPLSKGAIVELHDMSDELGVNGLIGTVEDRDDNSCSYIVDLKPAQDGTIAVPVNKVNPRCRIWNLDYSISTDWLQWRKGEQESLFIASDRHHNKFHVHLPLRFASWWSTRSERSISWPVLVYLHGTGGSSFFSHSKKSIKSVGMNFAAEKFAVVSPACNWNWKDSPKSWVDELTQHLRAADWVDKSRIYLTGCSMGGMGAWEVGARNAHIFAAIAPVAGHHQADHRPFIARQLRDMPTLIVHSQSDETCPISLETPLWNMLIAEQGNKRVEVQLAANTEHCSMFERSFCDDQFLYEWLLRHRRP